MVISGCPDWHRAPPQLAAMRCMLADLEGSLCGKDARTTRLQKYHSSNSGERSAIRHSLTFTLINLTKPRLFPLCVVKLIDVQTWNNVRDIELLIAVLSLIKLHDLLWILKELCSGCIFFCFVISQFL